MQRAPTHLTTTAEDEHDSHVTYLLPHRFAYADRDGRGRIGTVNPWGGRPLKPSIQETTTRPSPVHAAIALFAATSASAADQLVDVCLELEHHRFGAQHADLDQLDPVATSDIHLSATRGDTFQPSRVAIRSRLCALTRSAVVCGGVNDSICGAA